MTTENIHIYGPTFSNFVRTVMLVCEEKDLSYSVGFEVNGENVAFKGKQHLTWHPFGKIPVLLEGDGKKPEFALPETSSICRYLDRDSQLQPRDKLDHASHDALCSLISIDIDKILVREYLLEFAFPKGEDNSVRIDIVNERRPNVIATLTIIEKMVSEGSTLSTEQFTLADALLVPMLHYISCLPTGYNLLSDFPKLTQYLDKLMARESCKKVLISKRL